MRRPDIPVLTTLRFPAAFAVLLYHFIRHCRPSQEQWSGLSSGVSFFYVLSGFILYYNYFDLTDRRAFWMARFARVWPLHIVTLALAFCLIPVSGLFGHEIWEITLPTNILLLQAWIPFHSVIFSYNGVAWSLSVEAFFYFSFPWLLKIMQKRGAALPLLATFTIGVTLMVIAMLFFPSRATFVSLNPLCRIFEFTLGMATCRLWMAREEVIRSAAAWTCLELTMGFITLALVIELPRVLEALGLAGPLNGWLATTFCAANYAAVIWIFAHQKGVLVRGLSCRPAEWFGEISFALYMCHQLFIRWLIPLPFPSTSSVWRPFFAVLIVTLAFSAALFHLVETPARRAILDAYKKRRLKPKTAEALLD